MHIYLKNCAINEVLLLNNFKRPLRSDVFYQSLVAAVKNADHLQTGHSCGAAEYH